MKNGGFAEGDGQGPVVLFSNLSSTIENASNICEFFFIIETGMIVIADSVF
jgi:hypothetical protein